jgi:hypothetical protein
MLIGPSGRLRSTWLLSDWMKSRLASRYHYEVRAQVALDVASHYPGGDYFEFGSDSLLTFRSFLSAFDLHGLDKVHPDTHFYAFDIFGKALASDKVSSDDRWFFEHYAGSDKPELAKAALARHRVLVDRCVIKQGYFQETLNDAFKEELRREDRKIGLLPHGGSPLHWLWAWRRLRCSGLQRCNSTDSRSASPKRFKLW